MPRKGRENVVQKTLVMKQMTQVVEVQPDPGSTVDDSMPELRRGADAMALVEAYSPVSRQRAGAFGLSAGVAMDLRLG